MQRIHKRRSYKEVQKYWLGMVALHEICQYQKRTKLLIHKHPFACLVKEITQDCGRYDLQMHVVMVLQEAAEYYLTGLLEDANLCAIHVKHVVIMLKVIQSACHICREHLHY